MNTTQTLLEEALDNLPVARAGDEDSIEATLLAQANSLTLLFKHLTQMALRAEPGSPAAERNLRLALRAQAQSGRILQQLVRQKKAPARKPFAPPGPEMETVPAPPVQSLDVVPVPAPVPGVPESKSVSMSKTGTPPPSPSSVLSPAPPVPASLPAPNQSPAKKALMFRRGAHRPYRPALVHA